MRLLDRYQLRELSLTLAYCLVGILVFWTSFELLGEIEELERRQLGVGSILLYLVHRSPLHLLLQIPVALMLSLLYVLTQHARHNELVAMRSAGLSLWRISMPYLAVGVCASLAMLALNEFAVPDAAARADAVLAGGGGGGKTGEATDRDKGWRDNLNFRDQESGRVWMLARFNVVTAEILGAHIQWRRSDGGREELMAERGEWNGSGWVFEGVTLFSFPPGPGALATRSLTNRLEVTDFPESPAHLRSEVKISRLLGSLKKSRQVQLSLREILTYRDLHRELTPQFDHLLRTWFHDRLASPWTCLVVVLIAIPAGAASGRRNVFVGVAATVFLAFGYFVMKEFCLALGSGGYVPPWLAAWAPNVVFGCGGFLAIRRLR